MGKRTAPDEFHHHSVGLLQWWALGPREWLHWYVDTRQRAYLVAVSNGQPGSISDADGNLITNRMLPAQEPEQAALL